MQIDNRPLITQALRETQREYGSLLGRYGVVKQANIRLLDLILKLTRENDRVLDIGCGSGFLLHALSKLLPGRYFGVDKYVFSADAHFASADPGALEAFCRGNGLSLSCADAEVDRLPFDDGSFDVVYCKAVIEHFHHSPRHMVMEAHRVLGDGGCFILSTPNLAKLERRVRFLLGKTVHPDYRRFYEYEGQFTGHIREHTMEEAVYAVERGGFRVEEAFYDVNPQGWALSWAKRLRRAWGDVIFVVGRK